METTEIIETIVGGINNKLTVKTITDNNDNTYTITTNDTLWLQVHFPLKISGNDYTIIDIVKNVSFTVSGDALPNVSTIDIYEPTFYHGTVINVKQDMANPDVYSRTPFIYLKELLEDDNFSKYSGSPIKKESDLVILFLTQCKMKDWKTVDHYTHSIAPMRNMVDKFIQSLYKSKLIGKFERYQTINHVNFGVYTTDKGMTKAIFNDQLSGIELRIKIPFIKQNCTN
jgi:hypothetical protein